MSRQAEILDELFENVLDGIAPATIGLTNEALALEMDPFSLLYGALIPALEEVGRLFETGKYFVPEMLVAARQLTRSSVMKSVPMVTPVTPTRWFD